MRAELQDMEGAVPLQGDPEHMQDMKVQAKDQVISLAQKDMVKYHKMDMVLVPGAVMALQAVVALEEMQDLETEAAVVVVSEGFFRVCLEVLVRTAGQFGRVNHIW